MQKNQLSHSFLFAKFFKQKKKLINLQVSQANLGEPSPVNGQWIRWP